MKILGIDYGKRKLGLALATSKIAEPHGVVRSSSFNEAVEKVMKVARAKGVETIVLGISEGKMAEETIRFAKELESKLQIPVIYQDETLSTKEAQMLSIEAGIKRKKRKALEDAFAATIILQGYLDESGG